MKAKLFLAVFCVLGLGIPAQAQGKFLTNEGTIVFYSHTAIEDITAENKEVASVLDSETGQMSVIVLMRAFQFEKKLMQEHFNENYVESDTYPKATFTGILMNNSDIDYLTNGEYQAEVKGELTIHGVTQEIRTRGSVEVKKEGILTKAEFLLNPEDYGIKIPGVVRKNIAKNLEIRIHLFHTPI